MARRKNQPSTGVLKIWWSMMKRIGRGLAAISSTGSTKLTWLQTRIAAPLGRDVLVAAHLEAVDAGAPVTKATKRSRYSGTSMKM